MVTRRPNINHAVRALLRDICRTVPEFQHIRPARILIVAGEARRASRATCKPLAFAGSGGSDPAGRRKPVVKIRGRKMYYCITLRPLFFRSGTARARVTTLMHELFHISRSFDGTLSDAHRHSRLGEQFEARLRPIARHYWKHCPPELWAPLAHDGEVRVLQWLERPGPAFLPERPRMRKLYTEEQLFYGEVRMITRGSKRAQVPRALVAKVH